MCVDVFVRGQSCWPVSTPEVKPPAVNVYWVQCLCALPTSTPGPIWSTQFWLLKLPQLNLTTDMEDKQTDDPQSQQALFCAWTCTRWTTGAPHVHISDFISLKGNTTPSRSTQGSLWIWIDTTVQQKPTFFQLGTKSRSALCSQRPCS